MILVISRCRRRLLWQYEDRLKRTEFGLNDVD